MSGYWVEAFNELKNNLASIKERNKKGKEWLLWKIKIMD
jgi:hypothetical protein